MAISIERRQVHKGRNIIERLVTAFACRAVEEGAPSRSGTRTTPTRLERLLRNLARRLDHEEPGVS